MVKENETLNLRRNLGINYIPCYQIVLMFGNKGLNTPLRLARYKRI